MKTSLILLVVFFFMCVCIGIIKTYAQEDIESLKSEAFKSFKENDYIKAEKIYWELLEKGVDEAVIYSDLGFILSMQPDTLKQGIQFFIKAMKKDPFYTEAYANMATVCYKLGQYDNAINYLSKATKIDPDKDEYYFSLGWIYLIGVKDKSKAIVELKKAIDVNNENLDAHYVLGLAYADTANKAGLLEEITSLRLLDREDLASSLENLTRGVYQDKANDYMSFESRKRNRDKTDAAVLLKKSEEEIPEEPVSNYSYGKGKITSKSGEGYTSSGKLITGQRQIKVRIQGSS
ncbi:MAG: tetratricopeptide repeat protein [Candidatus Omnitrophica bacterium]|nr:tetratricopeptide repeat protein [Candidatus Omnitrophota bacterium]